MFLRFRPVYCENSSLILSKRLAVCEERNCSCFLLGNSSATCSHGSFCIGRVGEKIRGRVCVRVCARAIVYIVSVSARVWLSHCFLVVLHATIYVVCEHVNRGGRACGCFFVCVCSLFSLSSCCCWPHVRYLLLIFLFFCCILSKLPNGTHACRHVNSSDAWP